MQLDADRDDCRGDLAIALMPRERAGLRDLSISARRRRVIREQFERVAFDRVEAGLARNYRAIVRVGLANLESETATAEVAVEALDRGNGFGLLAAVAVRMVRHFGSLPLVSEARRHRYTAIRSESK